MDLASQLRSAFRVTSLLAAFFLSATAHAEERPISFNEHIRPILTDRCFACHGLDSETVEAGLRLDVREAATESDAIIPGNSEESEVIARILSDDEDMVMSPVELHKPLNEEEVALLRRWIDEGAPYEVHWAYTPLPRNREPPAIESTWAQNAIDRFIETRLQEESVAVSEPADSVTLIRRLSFDLTGLPPTPEEVSAFQKDQSEQAYQDLVHRLLDSPRYGERMAIYWLDLVRYADTVGYHGDQNVSQSPYRDYVINAFNENMPYDRFVREQLAGDLLDDPTIDQLVASGYNRLNQTTEEGGAQPKEYLAIYFADRVRNVSQVFMGATVGCAQCHDHKYDPYTSKDFYSLGAFFADIEEVGKYSARMRPPLIPVPTAEQQQMLNEFDGQVKDAESGLQLFKQERSAMRPEWEARLTKSIDNTHIVETAWIDDTTDIGGQKLGNWNNVQSDEHPVRSGKTSRRQANDQLIQHQLIHSIEVIKVEESTQLYAWVYLDPDSLPNAIMLQWNDGADDGKSWDHRAVWGSDQIIYGVRKKSWEGYRRQGELPKAGQWIRLSVPASDVGFKPGTTLSGMAFTQFGGVAYWDQAGRIESDGPPAEIVDVLKVNREQRSEEQSSLLDEHFLAGDDAFTKRKSEVKKIRDQRDEFSKTIPTMVISKSVKPRTIRVLNRGNWMDESGEIVDPAIPEFLGQLDTDGERATRLDLANWICQSDNMLASRTMVNRLWYLMFGRGICSSVDDLGGQGTFPSNPELLDYLAVEFIDSGWDIKHMLTLMTTSNTYRQSSRPSPGMRMSDPYNDLFARQGRFRVSAEMVRDTCLSISGLLVEQVGGTSVKPYQPAGYYAQLNFPIREYAADKGDAQYRRGVYTHWQRTFLHPMLKAFDAPSREECTAMRAQSNTPLQALTLLNDPTFVEAARVFAARIMLEGGQSFDERLGWAYQVAVSHPIDAFAAEELRQIYEKHLAHYQQNPDLAEKLVKEGEAAVASELDAAELAAWTSVSRTILNLHETINRY